MKITKNDIKQIKGEYEPKAMICIVDEMSEVMSGGKGGFKLVSSIQTNLGSIARLGRAAGCGLVLATQRPSANVIDADLKNNIQMGCLLGDFDASASTLIFDEDISNRAKPQIKGRGFIKSGKEIYEFQSFWTEKEKHFVEKDMSQLPILDHKNRSDEEVKIDIEKNTEDNSSNNSINTSNNTNTYNNHSSNDHTNRRIPREERIRERNERTGSLDQKDDKKPLSHQKKELTQDEQDRLEVLEMMNKARREAGLSDIKEDAIIKGKEKVPDNNGHINSTNNQTQQLQRTKPEIKKPNGGLKLNLGSGVKLQKPTMNSQEGLIGSQEQKIKKVETRDESLGMTPSSSFNPASQVPITPSAEKRINARNNNSEIQIPMTNANGIVINQQSKSKSTSTQQETRFNGEQFRLSGVEKQQNKTSNNDDEHEFTIIT